MSNSNEQEKNVIKILKKFDIEKYKNIEHLDKPDI